jgi:PAS domain S-box-containing protein
MSGGERIGSEVGGNVRRWNFTAGALAGAGVLVSLYLLSRSNYLLFHSIIEVFSVVIACGVFMVAWNTRRWVANDYLLFLGIAYLFVGGLDFLHTLAYAGMGVFPGFGANLPTQLWIVSRYVESVSLLAAPLFLVRRARLIPTFFLYVLVAALGVASIWRWGVFPDAFVEGQGLTAFKIASEYVICGILAVALFFLYRRRAAFEREAFGMLSAAIVVTIASELAFTLYTDVYGFSNMVGHLLKVVSFYLVYRAVIAANLISPYGFLFRNIEESRIEAQHERDRAMRYLRVTGSAIVVLDADGRVDLVNRRACEILGYPEGEVLGKPWFESFLPERMRKDARRVFDRLVAGETGLVEQFENPVVTSGGEERLVSWNNTVLPESGDAVGVLISGEDITERKKAEEDLKDYLRQLEQANTRLQEMDQLKSIFLASMSHELRTPLNSIIGFTGAILMGMAGEISEEQRKQLVMVRNSANHLLSLINDILDISKVEAGKVELSLEEFSLDDVVREVVESLSHVVGEKGLELVTELPEGITVFGDRRRIKQVLMNLVSNAVKFTNEGSVRIAAGVVDSDRLEIRVVDTGVGIRDEDMSRLFQPFQQVEPALTKKHEGTGLGLYLSQKLASLLKADISAKSEYGKGSEFTFVVPLRQ